LVIQRLRVLGLDPGYGRCGWGVIQAEGPQIRFAGCGVIETPARVSFPARLLQIQNAIRGLVQEHCPQEAAIEQLYFAKNVKTGIDVGQARGVALVTCAQAGLEIFEYKPTEIKLAVTGYGAAPKDQVQKMVRLLLKLEQAPRLDDAADALATALCHVQSRVLKKHLQNRPQRI
jgi:crossover junction endodeoxyribonuclease RuvC